MRLLASQGNVPSGVIQAVQSMRCATCERLKPPQQPRPTTMPKMIAGQFGDELQLDVFYSRTINTETFAVLGMVDKATGFHQAIVLPDRNALTAFKSFETAWLRPYGIPYKVRCDPDTSFRGDFEQRLQSLGVQLEHCALEAHFQIGMVERRNALLRIVLEKLVDQFAVSNIGDIPSLLIAACHSVNSTTFTKGRSAYAAVFGTQPRLPDGVLTDENVLASSPHVHSDDHNPGLKASLVRSEAAKHLINLNMNKQLQRALLRKTRDTKIADLRPGQKCAVWRWSKRGLRKRGSWLVSRFLSWDPSSPGKMAWVRVGTTTALVTSEQLRCAYGFEDWNPNTEDIQALKDSTADFQKHLLQDQTGPPPLEDAVHQPVEDEQDIFDEFPPPTPASMVPATPAPLTVSPTTPATAPALPSTSLQQLTSIQQHQQQSTNIQVNIDSPTHVQHLQQSQHLRFGDIPKRREPRSRSHTPSRRKIEATRAQRAELPAVSQAPVDTATSAEHLQQTRENTSQHTHTPMHAEPAPPVSTPSILPGQQVAEQQPATLPQPASSSQQDQPILVEDDASPIHIGDDVPQPSSQQPPQQLQQGEQTAEAQAMDQVHQNDEPDSLPQLPMKRPFDSIVAFVMDDHANISRIDHAWDGSQFLGYGPPSRRFHRVYLASTQRKQDVKDDRKDPEESDSTQGSEDESHQDSSSLDQRELSRKEAKALDREIPWRQILQMPPAYVDKFLAAINKEADSWSEWRSVRPLSKEETKQVLADRTLSKRIMRSRACYRDKNCGQGELKAKCRIVCLGHTDPDLMKLTRTAPTPGRVSEMILFAMLVAGMNKELLESRLSWSGWIGDASTAFLQGSQPDHERGLPIFMKPPQDGLIEMTGAWKSELYQILGNIYGLSNAPHLWCEEVRKRLFSVGYQGHDFDHMLFYKRDSTGQLVSLLLVYVDDFIGIFRQDYDIGELTSLFTWGELKDMTPESPVTFKGKELCIKTNEAGRFTLQISMKKFISNLDEGTIPRGRLTKSPKLTPLEKQEYRSVSGCLQWVSTQARPEIGALVSLSNHGEETSIQDLKSLYEGINFLKKTPEKGIIMQDVPITSSSTILTYTDSSWANASRSGSQLGVIVGISHPDCATKTMPMTILDWKSGRSPRVCRSTLAAEAIAADEGSDRASHINAMLSELIYDLPAHKAGSKLNYMQMTDAKSLFDAVVADNPNLADKRSLVNVRAIQETVSSRQMRWVPTHLMWADGLTKVCMTLRETFHKWLQEPTATLIDPRDAEKKTTSEKAIH